MKALKITLLLAIFCLTFSGQSYDTDKIETNDTFKINKVEFKDIVLNKKKSNVPPQA
jgi:hypothetical protein